MGLTQNGILAAAAGILALGMTALAQPAAPSPWIHIAVSDEGSKLTKVNINVPVSAMEAAIVVGQDKIAKEIAVKMPVKNIPVSELRKLWNELRNSGDAQFVNVREKNQTVNISRKGRVIQIRVNDTTKAGKPQTVQVDVPVGVVDALLAGTGNELDLKNAIAQLRSERGDIVRVHDGATNVRIWIDEVSTAR
jgi:hypothetical protein